MAATWTQAFRRVVQGLPVPEGRLLYVQVWNEPNLNEEWEGAASPVEYGRFLVEMAAALRSIGNPRIVILNAPLSPGGEYYYLDYLEDMLNAVPASLWAFDVWASHPYPNNHPPEYNLHNGTARYADATIDLYQQELAILARHGRSGLSVLLTETGYALGHADFGFEGYPPIGEENRADYILRAFRDYWSKWPEVIGVSPFELVDPTGAWGAWDWLYPDGRSHAQFDLVRVMSKATSPTTSTLRLTFQAWAPQTPGTYRNDVTVNTAKDRPADANAHGHCHPHAHANPDAHGHPHPHAYRHRARVTDGHCQPHADRHSHAHGHRDRDGDARPHTNGEGVALTGMLRPDHQRRL